MECKGINKLNKKMKRNLMCMHVCINVRTYICMCVRMYICTYVRTIAPKLYSSRGSVKISIVAESGLKYFPYDLCFPLTKVSAEVKRYMSQVHSYNMGSESH
jgi:hypothetical protein